MSALKKGARYLRVDQQLYESRAFLTLPAAAMRLWVLLRMDFVPSRNGKILATLSTLRRKGWNSADHLRRHLPVLVERGLLAYTSRCGPNVFQRASRFRFTDQDVFPDPASGLEFQRATHDYLRWDPAPKSKAKRTTKPFFAQSGTRIDARPASGSTLVRHPDRGSEKPIRHPDRGESYVSARTGSGFRDFDRSKVRDPASGHTLPICQGVAVAPLPVDASPPASAATEEVAHIRIANHLRGGLLVQRLNEFRRHAA